MKKMDKVLLLVPLLLVPACSKSYGSKEVLAADATQNDPPANETEVDRAITERVQLAIQQERQLAQDARNVRVNTREGVVSLTGRVHDAATRDRFSIVANAVGSVVRVDNQLAVQPKD